MSLITRWLGLATAITLAVSAVTPSAASAAEPPFEDQPKRLERLVGRAVLPADTFAEGPTSGRYAVPAPFQNAQPVQGFSAVLDNGDGTFLAMPDNGFGSLENSADYHLRAYTIRPDFATATGGSGEIEVEGFIEFSDPDGLVTFATVNHFTEDRILTGADFDIESIQRAPDGTLWVGEEFGPFLLHFSAEGELLEAPYALPDFERGGEVRAPQTPFHQAGSVVRIMNALRTHAHIHGATHSPVVSPTDSTVPATVNPVSLNAAGYQVIPWTINSTTRMEALIGLGADGIITDRPDLLYGVVANHDADNDGVPGDWLLPDGRIDPTKFDAQGHRGARNLRPENTLPAFEAALDHLVNTLEGDTGISADGVAMLDHNATISASTCRRADGQPYTAANQVRVRDLTAAEIQATFICDRLTTVAPQSNDPALSPVSVAFGGVKGLIDPYVMPTTDQLLEFVGYYETHYRTGAGAAHPDAQVRADNAAVVRLNLETKVTPASETGGTTASAQQFVTSLAGAVTVRNFEARVDIQSFDWRTLLLVHEQFPAIRTAFLFQPSSTAGLFWPAANAATLNPVRAQGSGGFEGLALSKDGTKLYPLLEKPLVGGTPGELRFHEFDLATEAYTGKWWGYQLEPQGAAIGDFIFHGNGHGLVIERDNSQGDGLSSVAARPGDVGLGKIFSFPYVTVESVVFFDEHTIGILNDNNYPFSVGRHLGDRRPDDNEFIVIKLRRELRD